MNRLTMSFI